MEKKNKGFLNVLESENLLQLILCIFILDLHGIEGFLLPAKFTPATFKVEHEIEWNNGTINGLNVAIPEIVFKCKFDKTTADHFYTINWHIDGNITIPKAITQSPDDGNSDLREKDIGDRKYGIYITCDVTAYENATSLLGSTISSDPFFAGIRPKTSKVYVERGNQNGTVFELEFTVPFGCIHVYSQNDLHDCIISIEMDYDNHTAGCGLTVGVLGLGSQFCSHRIKGYTRTKHQNGEKWTSTFSWNVSNGGGSLEHSNAYKLHLKALTSSSLYTFWNNYEIGDINVEIEYERKSLKTSKCYIQFNGLNMKTFDGSTNNVESPGVFTMYSNKIYPVEVQIKTMTCSFLPLNVHCVCGVYIRAGRDIVIMSICNSDVFFNFTLCEDGLLSVRYRDAYSLEVNLPTGANVTLTIVNQEGFVTIESGVFDEHNVDGLCGYYDGDTSNDFILNDMDLNQEKHCRSNNPSLECRNRFIRHYRVRDDHILFPITARNSNYVSNLPSWKQVSELYCVCPYDDGLVHRDTFAGSVCSDKQHQSCNYQTVTYDRQMQTVANCTIETYG